MSSSDEGGVPLARAAVMPFVAGFLTMAGIGALLSFLDASAAGSGVGLTPEPAGAAQAVPAVTADVGGSLAADYGVEIEDWASTFVTVEGLNVDIYDEPDGDVVRELRSADVLTVPGATPLVLLVVHDPAVDDEVSGWYEVYLPVRPNGTTGWVSADDVQVDTTDFWIEVSLSGFEMVVHEGSTVVLRTKIGVGRDDRPTPGGVYYLKELLKVPDPGGAYGPYAYGLSGYQSTLDSFNGGQAVIGIHGTNDPTSFGRVVSSGCIRVPNGTITRLAEEIGPPLGTPVRITE